MAQEPIDMLLVDDNEDDLALVLRALRLQLPELRISLARDGREALDLLAEGRLPKLVLLDLDLPGLDGRAVLEKIRKNEATRFLPVVVFTSSDFPAHMEASYLLGANSYIRKLPYGEKLREALANIWTYWSTVNKSPAVR